MERKIPKQLILSTAFIQGIVLFALFQAIENSVWPHGDAVSLNVLLTLSIAMPVMIMLSSWHNNPRYLSRWLIPFAIGLGLVAAYTGYQLQPEEFVREGGIVFSFVVTLGIASFKALMYIQQHTSKEKISYSALFSHSWRNFLVLGFVYLFVAIFWGILMLWASLFKILDIQFFYDTFTSEWFFFPVLSVAAGFAIIIFRNKISVIDTISQLLQALIKYLLPVVMLVAMLFLATLLFSGLELLWKTGSGSQMILWLLAIALFFVNAVYQDKSDVIPYPLFWHRFIYAGVAILPIYSLIAAYGLYVRIDQYGWTIGRSWGVLICALLTMFTLGYIWGIVKEKDNWITTLSTVNVRMGIVVMVLMLLINSPVIDFRKISVNSQMARIQSGKTDIKDIDVRYFRNKLGRPGYLALQDMKVKISKTHPDIVKQIDSLYVSQIQGYLDLDAEKFKEIVNTYPRGMKLPTDFVDALLTKLNRNKWSRKRIADYYLIEANLDYNDKQEYVLIIDLGTFRSAELWYLDEVEWKSRDMRINGNLANRNIDEWLSSSGKTIIPKRWKILKIGDIDLKTHDF